MLLIGVLAGIAAYAGSWSELLWLASVLVLLPVAAWIYVRFRPLGYAADRAFIPPVVEAGAISTVQLNVSNVSGLRSPQAHWRDTWPWRPFVTTPSRVGSLAARSRRLRLEYEFTPARRGMFDIGPMIVDFTDPFGLADGAIIARGTSPLVVTPTIVDLPDGAVALAADEGPTRMRQRRAYGGEDDLMTREYRRGDPMRRVHWRASAHHGELMVRQEEQRSHAEARILLDTARSGYRDARGAGMLDEAESECFEWAVSLCASLSVHLVERGFVVQVIETGAHQLAPVDQLDEFLRSLAAVQLTEEPTDRPRLLGGMTRPDQSQGSLFAILSHSDPDLVGRLIAQRPSFDLAVAFLVDTWASPHFEPLRSAGFLCVPVHPGDSIEDAWLTVGAEQESAHGRF
jgi:uncharacterized protein (DUF58 family)